ncbi:MAG: YidH family protein [Candidatus Eiseniibacteriota bacterium]
MTESLPSSNELALERTRLAHERTMMAWIRTGTSLISFGFSIYKFFDISMHGSAAHEGPLGPRTYGFAMIFTGLVAILIAMVRHRGELRVLRATGVKIPWSEATLVGALVSLLGILGLAAVIFRQ